MIYKHELTHAGVITSFQLGASKNS